MKFRVIDSENNHLPVKGGFISAQKAAIWCKKHLPAGSWKPWGSLGLVRYYIMGYNN